MIIQKRRKSRIVGLVTFNIQFEWYYIIHIQWFDIQFLIGVGPEVKRKEMTSSTLSFLPLWDREVLQYRGRHIRRFRHFRSFRSRRTRQWGWSGRRRPGCGLFPTSFRPGGSLPAGWRGRTSAVVRWTATCCASHVSTASADRPASRDLRTRAPYANQTGVPANDPQWLISLRFHPWYGPRIPDPDSNMADHDGIYHQGPFRFHADVVLVREEPRHVTHRHLLIDQQRFRAPVRREGLPRPINQRQRKTKENCS